MQAADGFVLVAGPSECPQQAHVSGVRKTCLLSTLKNGSDDPCANTGPLCRVMTQAILLCSVHVK
jgi:hypothetical protein